MVTPSQALTKQFYEWEQRGRGWYLCEHKVELEPAFEPFWGHHIPGEIIDDGKRPSFIQSLFSEFENPPNRSIAPPTQQQIVGYLAPDITALSVFSVTLLKNKKIAVDRMEQLLVMLSYRKKPISFEIIGDCDHITLQWTCREEDELFVYTQLNAFLPEIHIQESHIDALWEIVRLDQSFYIADFGLDEEFMRPISMNGNNDSDPYTAFFGILESLHYDEYIVLQIIFSGTHNDWSESILTAVTDDSGKASFFFDDPDMPRLAKEKISTPLFGASVRLFTSCEELSDAAVLIQHGITAITHASSSSFNRVLPLLDDKEEPAYPIHLRLSDMLMRESHRTGMLLNSRELATFVHFPDTALQTRKVIHDTKNTKTVPQSLIGHPYQIGANYHQGTQTLASLPTAQRLRHIHIIGATGTGKSTLLHSLIAQDIYQGNGGMVIDPHGDLINTILASIPKERINDVIVIDPSDREFPIGFNILSAKGDIEKELLASDLVALFKRFSTSWGDQMNSVLANAIMAIVYNTKIYHLGDLRKLLIDPAYRTTILSTVTDSEIVYYWQKEFPILKNGSIGSIITRLDSFLRPRVIRNMVCQKQSLDFAELMDTKKIVLVKLSQGLLGAENSFLLGAFIVSKLQQTAMARQSQEGTSRIPFYCYIDEFQHFVTPSMGTILSGARKYGLGLILAHQDMVQVSKYDSDIASSVLSNAGTRICFRLGDSDAKRMQEGFSSFTQEDLQNLATGEAIARVNTNDSDFNLEVLPFKREENEDYSDNIIAFSRERYSVPITDSVPVPTVPTAIIEGKKEHQIVPPDTLTPKTPQNTQNAETVRKHRYQQAFIKKIAEGFGYRASIEVPTPDGTGLVDVLLERAGKKIAVEISVTTTPEWELHNIQKCLSVGYNHIIMCTQDEKKAQAIKELVKQSIIEDDINKVLIITIDQFQSLFVPEAAQETSTLIKGYRVKVKYDTEGVNQHTLLQTIINTSHKR